MPSGPQLLISDLASKKFGIKEYRIWNKKIVWKKVSDSVLKKLVSEKVSDSVSDSVLKKLISEKVSDLVSKEIGIEKSIGFGIGNVL